MKFTLSIAMNPLDQLGELARAAEEAVAGAEASAQALRSAAERADEGTQPPSDLHGGSDYRRHLARVLTARALAAASGV